MSLKVRQASALALAATLGFTIAGANGSGAFAQDISMGSNNGPAIAPAANSGGVAFVSHEVVQPLPDDDRQVENADSLKELVEQIDTDGSLSQEMQCLAGAIYFEARGEPLVGQLAVGRVIVNRTESGRFPTSYCGVVFQPGQFSFVHGGHMPKIKTSSVAWSNAKAIAKIAQQDLWNSPAKGALFFHAASVKPHWGLTEVAQVDNHVFYR